MKLVARVEDFFQLSHRGYVITIRLLSEDGLIRLNEKVRIRKPDGQVKDTYVSAIEHVKYNLLGPPPDRSLIGVALSPDITKQDVPRGTEIWNFRE